MAEGEWVELLFDAPDRRSLENLVPRLLARLPENFAIHIGLPPGVPPGSPPPPRHVVTGLARSPGAGRDAVRENLVRALGELRVRVDVRTGPGPSGLTVITL